MTQNIEHSNELYPQDITLKVIGKSNERFRGDIFELLKPHFPTLPLDEIKVKPSKQGNYQSLAIQIRIQDQAHLVSTYALVRGHPEVVFVL